MDYFLTKCVWAQITLLLPCGVCVVLYVSVLRNREVLDANNYTHIRYIILSINVSCL